MDDIEKVGLLERTWVSRIADEHLGCPWMYRTVTDLAYSRSPECPFELSTADLRSRLYKYENEKTLLPPDTQIGVRKSIAAALGKRKGPRPEGKIHAVVYPYSVDVERIVDGLWGPRQPFADKIDSRSGTMLMIRVPKTIPRRSHRSYR